MKRKTYIAALVVIALAVVASASGAVSKKVPTKNVTHFCFWVDPRGGDTMHDMDTSPNQVRGASRGWKRTCVHGLRGKAGATGATGATGAAGPKGDTGATGPKGDGCIVREQGIFYKQDVVFCPVGPKGDTGATGPQGPAGKDGTGLGNGVIYACVSNGGTLQLDVKGQPCDNQGHMPIELVVVTQS